MTDIVERLRNARTANLDGARLEFSLLREAADEIERLRTALKKIASLKYDHQDMNDIAFAAIKDII